MVPRALTGSRIRQKRLDLGLRQSDLAERVGISASYLNLIEHNRRGIAGRLLQDLARALGVEVQYLSEGAQAVSQDLRLVAARHAGPGTPPETERAEEFAGRFPGWAALVAGLGRSLSAAEARVAALSDRLAHDAGLAAALHEVISSATAIRASAGILEGTPDLDRDWQGRFLANITADSARLAEGSRRLAALLEAQPQDARGLTPQEAAAAALARLGDDTAPEPLPDPAAEVVLQGWLATRAADAAALPEARLIPEARAQDWSLPEAGATLARRLGLAPDLVWRRLATLKPAAGLPAFGLVEADASGAVTALTPLPGLPFGFGTESCPFWPLYRAAAQPHLPLAAAVTLPGPEGAAFAAEAVATWGHPPRLALTMLLRPIPKPAEAIEVGPGCRLCARPACPARRAPALFG